jgi:uncharacterized membrane protein
VRNLLLFAHVVGAILLLGPATMATSRFARHVSGDEGPSPETVAAATDAHQASRAYGTASIVVPAIGIAMAARNEVFDQLWVQASIGLFVVGALVLAAGHLPAQSAALALMWDGRPATPKLLGRLRATAGLYATSWVVIAWLMVAKPN